MDVSVIIVNYNTKVLLEQCLTSVYKKILDVIFEVIVVDNASSDGSQQMVKENFPSVILVESQTNLGFGRANNLGNELAKGKYIFLLNSDTILLNNALKYFFDFSEGFRTNTQLGAIGCVLLDKQKVPVHSSGKFPTLISLLKGSLYGYITLSKKERIHNDRCYFGNDTFFKVDYITGADLFMSNKVFKILGGFDEIFFMYYEETDLQWRMSKMGLERFLIKGPRIIHLEGGSAGKKSNKSVKIYERSKYAYVRKRYNKIQYTLFKTLDRIILFPFLLRRIILQRISIRKWKS